MKKFYKIEFFVFFVIICSIGLIPSSNNAFANANYIDPFDISGQDTSPQGLAFNTDGTKMFLVGSQGNDIGEYACSTGFDISTCAFTDNRSVNSQETSPSDVTFNTDGTKMFVTGYTGDDVNEYTLATGFDLSSTFNFVDAFDLSNENDGNAAIAFNTDGTKMFVGGMSTGGDEINEYACSTGFDVSTCDFTDAFDVSNQETNLTGLEFNTDGTKMFVTGVSSKSVNEYLCHSFDVSTCKPIDSFPLSVQDANPQGLAFNTDGTKMFVTGFANDNVYEYILSIGFDLIDPITPSTSTTTGDHSAPNTFPPHIHDEVTVSINSNDEFNLNLKDKEITKIVARVGDTVDIIISMGDDQKVDTISKIQMMTNFAQKPSGINPYFANNYNDYRQVALSVYEWNLNKDDIPYDYAGTLSWNEPSMMIRERTLTNHDYVGPSLSNEKELIAEFSLNMNNVMSETQIMTKITDGGNEELHSVLPFTLEIIPNDGLSKEDLNLNESISPKGFIVDPLLSPDNLNGIIMNTNFESYRNGDKVIINGQIQNYDFDMQKGKNLIYELYSPNNKFLFSGHIAPETNGSFSFTTFSMDSSWKIDGNYVFIITLGSLKATIPILYDNTLFENPNFGIENISAEPVIDNTITVPEPVIDNTITVPEPVIDNTITVPEPVIDNTITVPEPVIDNNVNTSESETLSLTTIPICGPGTIEKNNVCMPNSDTITNTEMNSSRGGGCLIATATYGSEFAPQVQQLREIRDNQLMNTESGSAFMSGFNELYYTFSPTIADMERESPMFKEAVKLAITPMLSTLSLMENAESESEVLSMGISVIALNLGMYLGIPAIVVIGIKKRN
jgi:hypothetical protein